jgi:hypothetical protein
MQDGQKNLIVHWAVNGLSSKEVVMNNFEMGVIEILMRILAVIGMASIGLVIIRSIEFYKKIRFKKYVMQQRLYQGIIFVSILITHLVVWAGMPFALDCLSYGKCSANRAGGLLYFVGNGCFFLQMETLLFLLRRKAWGDYHSSNDSLSNQG